MTPMQSFHRILALATLAATALLSQALHAQTNTYTSSANVPFGFEYADQHFAAGTYTISLHSNILSVGNQAEFNMGVVQSSIQPVASPASGYLTFRRYGNRYFLAEYHGANNRVVARIAQWKKERSVARDYAANRVADQGRVRLAILEIPNPASGR